MTKSHSFHILLLCFFTYLTVYLMRVNFSSALPLMSGQLHFSEAQLGLAGAGFFMTYAFGQLINGLIADAVSPFRFILTALVGTIAANLLVSSCTNFWMIFLFWAVNGYFQSIFWSCLNRILSFYYSKEKHSMVATTMSASMVGGFIMTWVVLTKILGESSWRAYFFVPSLCGIFMFAIWLTVFIKTRNMEIPRHKLSLESLRQSAGFIVEKKIYYLCFICMCMGFVKESISVWGPVIISSLLEGRFHSSALVLFIIPLGNLCGMFFAKYLIDRFQGNELKTLTFLFVILLTASVFLLLLKENVLVVSAAMIIIVSAMSYGCNSILLSFVPLAYTKYNLVSTLIGIFDFSSYIGASVSSFAIGNILTSSSWVLIVPFWIGILGFGLLFCRISRKKTELL